MGSTVLYAGRATVTGRQTPRSQLAVDLEILEPRDLRVKTNPILRSVHGVSCLRYWTASEPGQGTLLG